MLRTMFLIFGFVFSFQSYAMNEERMRQTCTEDFISQICDETAAFMQKILQEGEQGYCGGYYSFCSKGPISDNIKQIGVPLINLACKKMPEYNSRNIVFPVSVIGPDGDDPSTYFSFPKDIELHWYSKGQDIPRLNQEEVQCLCIPATYLPIVQNIKKHWRESKRDNPYVEVFLTKQSKGVDELFLCWGLGFRQERVDYDFKQKRLGWDITREEKKGFTSMA